MSVFDEQNALNGFHSLDSQSIGAIYDRYFPEIYRYVRYRINDNAVAEDIASDVFVSLLDAVQKTNGPQKNIKGWLIATASNMVNDHFRRQYRRPTEKLSASMPDAEANVHAEVDLRERSLAVRTAYARLTHEQQHVLALRFNLGYSLEETARYMKKKVNAVKALQFRALASLHRLIGEVDYE